MYRTVQEQRELTFEAERRVRAGEPRAEVARSLGIPLSTLSDWAHRGGWRRKDLVSVRDESRGKMILTLINEMTSQAHAKEKEDVAKLQQALDASKAELEAVAPGGKLPLLSGGGVVPAGKLAMAMADSLLRQGQLEEADRAIRLAARFAEAEQAANAGEEAKWREERERLMKWWAETHTAYSKLHTATDEVLSGMVSKMQNEISRSADECCPTCGRRMDFWPEEVERPDDDDSGDFDGDDSDDSGDDSDDDDSGGDSSQMGAGDSADDFRGEPAGAGGLQTEADIGCHPHWKKDANGSWYWDGPPGE